MEDVVICFIIIIIIINIIIIIMLLYFLYDLSRRHVYRFNFTINILIIITHVQLFEGVVSNFTWRPSSWEIAI